MNFDVKSLRAKLPKGQVTVSKDPRFVMRVVLGVLLLANVVAALMLFKPWGASPEELEQQLGALRGQLQQKQTSVERLRVLVGKSDQAREEGDAFMGEYFMDRRTASSTIVTELKEVASKAGIKQEEHTFSYEPIEGSEDLSMMTISGNYEGSYTDLVEFINLLDRSPRFLIVDTLTASPERTNGLLNVNFKLNAFVIEGAAHVMPKTNETGEQSEPEAAEQPDGGNTDGNEPPADKPAEQATEESKAE